MSAQFGLDIGTTSIKLLKLSGNSVEVLGIEPNKGLKNIALMSGPERLMLAQSLRDLISKSGLKDKRVVASISEALVYSRVMRFPVMSTPELSTAIKWELDQSVPFPPNEIETSWSVMDKPDRVSGDEKMLVYVVAVPTPVSEAYTEILEGVGLTISRLENEVPGLFRAFATNVPDGEAGVVVSIGESGTVLFVFDKEKIYSNYYLPFGGGVMTKMIADSFHLQVLQAENYKRTYGIQSGVLEDRLRNVLSPIVNNMIGEIKKMMIAFSNEHSGRSVGKVYLSGGGSYLPGLVPYLSSALEGVEVVMGNVFESKKVDQKYISMGNVFASVYGLALEN